MATIKGLAAELKAWLSGIDPLVCPTLVLRALKEILDSRDWSFLKQNGVWFTPQVVSSGSVTTSQFSKIVTADATAAPLWQAVALTQPPAYPLTMRQFRIQGNALYNIADFDGTNKITLDRPMAEASGSGLTYMIYQPYQPAPALDFKRWLSIVDPVSAFHFRYEHLFHTQKELDRVDPQRTNFGWPTWVVAKDYVTVPGDTEQRPRFELAMGHPTQELGYILEYMITGAAGLSVTYVIPQQISDQTIMARAKYYGHELAANQPNIDDKQRAFHSQKMPTLQAQYVDLLRSDQQNDNSIFDSKVIDERPGPRLSGPLDANFLQSHELYWTI